MGAPLGNRNAAGSRGGVKKSKKGYGKKKSYFTKEDIMNLARKRSPSLLSKQHSAFLKSAEKASKLYFKGGSYRFVKNVQKSVARQRLQRGL